MIFLRIAYFIFIALLIFGVGAGIGSAIAWLANRLLFGDVPEFTGTDYED
jgi:hypothetical protein